MVKKIALEEHFLSPGLVDYWRPTMTEVAPERGDTSFAISPISANCGCKAWTAPASPAQSCRSPAPACRPSATPRPPCAARASRTIFSRGEIDKRPDRYSGFAHLAMQDAESAADELERCIRELEVLSAP